MAEKVVPMIHVSDVRATVDWYESIGFTVSSLQFDRGFPTTIAAPGQLTLGFFVVWQAALRHEIRKHV